MSGLPGHPSGIGLARKRKAVSVVISEILVEAASDPLGVSSLGWLVQLLKDEGVDLLKADPEELQRGTPVYVHASADVLVVQRLMALNHIRMLPVVRGEQVVGIVDLVELAQRDDLVAGQPIEGSAR
jgi:CBS domain-containing protein